MVDIQVTVRGANHRRALDKVLRRHVDRCRRYCDDLRRCRIVIDVKLQEPRRFDVSIQSFVPGRELVAKVEGRSHLSIAVSDAFEALTRRLDRYADAHSGRQKRVLEARRARRASNDLIPDDDLNDLAA